MLIFRNQGLYCNAGIVHALIAITLVIGNCCSCIVARVLQDEATTITNNLISNDLNLMETNSAAATTTTTTNENSNQKDNEVVTSKSTLVRNTRDQNILIGDTITPEPLTGTYVNVSRYPGEYCNRRCVTGELRVCYFEFTLEYYQAMGVACGQCEQGVEEDCNNPQCIVGDGVEKGVMSINRQIPGPALHVCKDDLVIIDVHNHAHGTAAALHWHGLHMETTPFMDGVPYVTQCPIPFGNTFRYEYFATESGTHFYHAHAGHHKVNGQYGALIIRSAEDTSRHLYDYDLPEHHILISDWMHSYGEQYFPGLPSLGGIYPNSVLINGRGVYTNPITRAQTEVPPTVYYVTPGKRYLFRLINSVSHACPFKLQIEKHNLHVVASDAYNLMPTTFDTIISNTGERYDFVLDANHTEGDFWIRVRGLGKCEMRPTESYALLRYETNEVIMNEENLSRRAYPRFEEEYPLGTVLNHPNVSCWYKETGHCITELKSVEEDSDLLKAFPDHQFFLGFNNYPVPNEEIFRVNQYNRFENLYSNLTLVGAINNLSLVFPDSPLLTQASDIDDSQFCDEGKFPDRCAGHRLCPCVHRLQVKLNSVVELIIVDETEHVGNLHHPFHLHGYRFMVTGLGQHPEGGTMSVDSAKELEYSGMLPREEYNKRPPFKDTVSIPSRGYTVLRLRATNPGFWLMHCHYEWHLSIGMALIMQVGNTTDMVRPPTNFPRCGNYVPPVRTPRF